LTNTNRMERAASRLDGWLGAHRRLYLGLAAALSLATFSGYAHNMFPRIDEVLELIIVRQSGVKAIWAALMDSIQVDPPVLDSALHFLFRIFGEHVFLARLPSVAGFTLVCVSLTCLVWRHAPPVYAAAVFFLPFSTILRSWGMDMRPYSLMMGLSALTLLCWDGMEGPRHRTAWRIGFTLSLAATFSTHFYSILLLFALGCGELVKWIERRRPDWRALLSMGVALIPYLLWTPILFAGSRLYLKHYFYPAAFQTLDKFYGWAIAGLPMAGLLLALLATAGAMRGGTPAETAPREALSNRQKALLGVIGGFLLLPVAGFAAGTLFTGFFVPYYHMIATFGVILGIPLALAMLSNNNRVAGMTLFAVVLAYGLIIGARGISGFVRIKQEPYPALSDLRKLIPESRPDIVVSSAQNFLPFQDANRFDAENNLLYLYDASKATKELGGMNTLDVGYPRLRGRSNARIEPYEAYTAAHRRFYLAVMGDMLGIWEWHFHYLLKQGNTNLHWLGKVGVFDLYRVDLPAAT